MSHYATYVTSVPNSTHVSLTRREREIMDAVFALGNRASAEQIRSRLTNPPGDSAVRMMLTRLEKKGALRHQYDGPRYIYSASVSPGAAKRTALKRLAQTFFGGSLPQMVTELVAEESWTDAELDAMQGEINRARKESANAKTRSKRS
jgi:BlaI family transcriptional regulator, penicillinase repressor